MVYSVDPDQTTVGLHCLPKKSDSSFMNPSSDSRLLIHCLNIFENPH